MDVDPNLGAVVDGGVAFAARAGALLSNGTPRPAIRALEWVSVPSVLPDEARDFTPWLAENLHLLAPVLGLEDLTLVQEEYAVLGFSLDILAQSVGPDGAPVWVAIENQYRRTDHVHLGQLLTYAAHAAKDQERVLAVWITEQVHPAHVATIEFLNRTTSPAAGVGYMLLQVRLAPGPSGTFHVFFEVAAGPNEFLQSGIQSSGTSGASTPSLDARRNFMTEVFELVRPAALAAGAYQPRMDPAGWQISLRFPPGTALSAWPIELWVRMSAKDFYVNLSAWGTKHSAEENSAALDVVNERCGADVERALPEGTTVNWHAGYEGYATDYASCRWGEGGYANGDPVAAGTWAARIVQVWFTVVAKHSLDDLNEEVHRRIEKLLADELGQVSVPLPSTVGTVDNREQ